MRCDQISEGFGPVGTNGPSVAELDGSRPAYPMSTNDGYGQYGMSKREAFAMALYPQVYACAVAELDRTGYPPDWRTGVAIDTLASVDALLAQLNQEPLT